MLVMTCDPPDDACSASIKHVLRLFPRERLLVRPYRWTSRHLDLLGCHFKDVDGDEEADETESPTLANERQGRGIRSPAEQLATCLSSVMRHSSIRKLLDFPASDFRFNSNELGFRFAGCKVDRLGCTVFSSSSTEDATVSQPLPCLAYIDYFNITRRRKNLLEPQLYNRGGVGNYPGYELFKKQLSRLTPENRSQDPFVVSVLIALAQAQQQFLAQLPEIGPVCSPLTVDSVIYTPLALLTFHKDRSIHLYRANIPCTFLRKLEELDYAPMAPIHITVQHSKISFRPFETLLCRLMTCLAQYPTMRYMEPETSRRPRTQGDQDTCHGPAVT